MKEQTHSSSVFSFLATSVIGKSIEDMKNQSFYKRSVYGPQNNMSLIF